MPDNPKQRCPLVYVVERVEWNGNVEWFVHEKTAPGGAPGLAGDVRLATFGPFFSAKGAENVADAAARARAGTVSQRVNDAKIRKVYEALKLRDGNDDDDNVLHVYFGWPLGEVSDDVLQQCLPITLRDLGEEFDA